MNKETFQQLIQQITNHIGHRPLDASLQKDLNTTFPAGGATFTAILEACKTAVEQGWMCQYEAGGLRYGRVIKPAEALNGYSVDVVLMENMAGAYHRHPHGEIDLIMPLQGDARFDGHPAGWLVYGPETAHSPTLTQGQALVLYLLPQGAIEFTKP